jgi:NRPS condensation-like uncharacterized protein
VYDFYDMPQYRFILIPDFCDGKSAILVKSHHSLSDGLGFTTFLQSLNDNYNPADLPAMRPISPIKMYFLYFISPLLILWVLAANLTLGKDSNAIKKDGVCSGKKILWPQTDMKLPKMKIFCKESKCTINDYCTALLSISLHEYFKNEEIRAEQAGEKVYKMPKELKMSVPFSLRQPFKSLKDVKMVNDFGGLNVKMVPIEHFDQALDYYAKVFHALKTSLMPFGVVFTTRLAVMLPFNLPKLLVDDLTDKYTMVFSNLVASKNLYIWNGKKNLSHFFIPPGVGKLYTGIGLCSIGPNLSLTVFSDKAMLSNPKALCDIIVRKNNELVDNAK